MRRVLALAALVVACGGPAARAPEGPSLDAKLEAQWKRDEAARALLLQRVVRERGIVARGEWEHVVGALDAEGIAELHARQLREAAASEAASRARSRLDLDRLRASGDIDAFCKDLPKGGMLHVHAGGVLDRDTVARLLERFDPVVRPADILREVDASKGEQLLYPAERGALGAIARAHGGAARFHELAPAERARMTDFFLLPPGAHPFERFDAIFSVMDALVGDQRSAWYDFAFPIFFDRARAHHVRYVEVARYLEPSAEGLARMDAWRDTAAAHGIEARIQASFFRFEDPEKNRAAILALLAAPRSATVTSINIMGNEARFPALETCQTVYALALSASGNRLHRTFHAGELGDARNPRDALLLGAERLGHAVRLRDDPVALERARRAHVGIEANLVSNVRLGAVASVREHPFLFFLRLGLDVSFSTDDEGPFGSTIDDECIRAVSETNITWDELQRTSRAAIETAFVDEPTRARLRSELAVELAGFEARWSSRLR